MILKTKTYHIGALEEGEKAMLNAFVNVSCSGIPCNDCPFSIRVNGGDYCFRDCCNLVLEKEKEKND